VVLQQWKGKSRNLIQQDRIPHQILDENDIFTTIRTSSWIVNAKSLKVADKVTETASFMDRHG